MEVIMNCISKQEKEELTGIPSSWTVNGVPETWRIFYDNSQEEAVEGISVAWRQLSNVWFGFPPKAEDSQQRIQVWIVYLGEIGKETMKGREEGRQQRLC